MANYFVELNTIDVSDKVEKKNGLTYLSWAYAWGELKKRHQDATYTVYENVDGWNYFTDGKTAWVKTGVTVEGIEHIEYLPIMDFRNKSIPAENITSFDVNKAIQRSLTKAVARHGLGLYIYAGEDIPEQTIPQEEPEVETKPNMVEMAEKVFKAKRIPTAKQDLEDLISSCNDPNELKQIYFAHEKEIVGTPDLLDLITKRGDLLEGVA